MEPFCWMRLLDGLIRSWSVCALITRVLELELLVFSQLLLLYVNRLALTPRFFLGISMLYIFQCLHFIPHLGFGALVFFILTGALHTFAFHRTISTVSYYKSRPYNFVNSVFNHDFRCCSRVKDRSSALSMKGPTKISVESEYESECNFKNDKDATLTRYMMLPVEHLVFIDMPRQSSLVKHDGEDFFTLTTPAIRFFQIDVSPIILCKLQRLGESIVIRSEKCELKGGTMVDKLNGCFNIDVCTTLTWTDTAAKKAIHSKSRIEAVIDPPAPFKYLGSSVLHKSGTMGMSLALKQIENAFVGSLTKDFEKWTSNTAFRSARDANIIQLKSDMINYDTDVDRPLNELLSSNDKIISHSSTSVANGGNVVALAKLELENAELKKKLNRAELELRNVQQAVSKLSASLR